ncbi:pilus assembly PilX family protein [Tahibacter amnicola]|uniref:PilX N-terminal domain-containing pilus assembly protein n=1 Tax=Tahibacter amnicola TaxID=2976241 RepID=A0ABY6BEZ3_9GAMM|nr:PilX N-terminal domain-containing pilus assembly protein [Tahibacter amnicola]UXI67181.1 PilX N-terminal domain-containing pilus assembly protein [Tahibacter amnicola]
MTMSRFKPIPAQDGAVLFVSLIFLIIISLIAVTASWNSVLQERMTGGMRNRQLGTLGAESALRAGEAFVWTQIDRAVYSPTTGCVPLKCDEAGGGANSCYTSDKEGRLVTAVQKFRTDATWGPMGREMVADVTGLSGDYATASLASQPQYIVEELGSVSRTVSEGSPGGGGGGGGGGGYRQTGADNDRGRQVGPGGSGGGGGGGVDARTLYRVTARSQGGSDATVRVVESTFIAKKITSCNPV